MSELKPLSRDEVVKVIERKGAASRVPMMVHFWTSPPDFGDRQGELEHLLDQYPQDIERVHVNAPGTYNAPADDSSYRWMNVDDPHRGDGHGIDEIVAIEDWSQLDDILADWPNPNWPGLVDEYGQPGNPEAQGGYRLGSWWFCFFERHWSLRGMTNALMDFYTDPDEVHRLYDAVTTFYEGMMERAKEKGRLDGIFVSDDLGTQTGPFFSPDIFREFFFPYYKRLFDKAHSLGMHFWLHTCGNVEAFLPMFIEAGLDVIHPIQKYTMEEKVIAENYGDQITFWAGFDVQQTIPYGTAEDVRKEVRFMYDTYWREDGGLMLTCGNGLTPDTPLSSIEALLDEAYYYGLKKGANG